MIPKNELETGQWYVGKGRFIGKPCVAMWDKHQFIGLSIGWGQYEPNAAEYGERGFTPLRKVQNA